MNRRTVAALIALLVITDLTEGETDHVNWFVTVGGIALFMAFVGLLACLRPALRGVRIQPTEALREG